MYKEPAISNDERVFLFPDVPELFGNG
jgi:hypothetical protein